MGVSEQSFRDDSDSGDFCGDNYEDAVLSPRGLLHADQDFFASDYFNCLSALFTDTKNEHGIPPYDGLDRSSTGLSLHAHPLLPPPALPLPQPLPPPPPLQSSVPQGMAGAAVRAPGVGAGDGGQVMVHWTQSGPSVQPATDRAGHQSADDDDDPDDEDDELLTPPPPRERLSYTRYQLELLNGIYLSVRYPNSVQKQLIAKRVGISREQVKIWFQNRRRKDVVSNKTSTPGDNSQSPSSSQDPASPTISTAASPTIQPTGKDSNSNSQDGSKQSPDANGAGEGQGDGGQKSRMVPDAVVQGCISELKRFSDEKLKERKEKRKAKGKRRAHHASTSSTRSAHSNIQGVANNPSQPVRLFQAYDMVAPPNKVTPTAAAYLNTAANRFNHSHNTSAFSSPRDHLAVAATMPRLAWDGMDTGLGQSLGGGVADQLAHTRAFGGLGMAGLGMGLMPMSQAQSVGVGMPGAQDSLPVLSDLLSYRQQMEGSRSSLRDSREASLPQSSFLPSSSSSRDSGKLPDLGSTHHNGATPAPPSFSLSRVYPFPFVADPPIMLSSLHQQDPLRQAHHWPHPHPPPPSAATAHFNPMASMNSMDPYKPVLISPLSNPFFSQAPHPPHWPPQPGGDPASGSGFSQP